jgi:hypothetical protein
MGVGKFYLISPKFISADGGFKRVVWMSSVLKETMADEFKAVCEREGDPDLLDKIADERNVTRWKTCSPGWRRTIIPPWRWSRCSKSRWHVGRSSLNVPTC